MEKKRLAVASQRAAVAKRCSRKLRLLISTIQKMPQLC